MNGDKSNALSAPVPKGAPLPKVHMAETYVLVRHQDGGTVTVKLTAGTLREGVRLTDKVEWRDIIPGHFEQIGDNQQFVTPTGRLAVVITVVESDVPYDTKLMLRGFPVVDGQNHKNDLYFVMGAQQGTSKICTGGVDMNQWGVHSVQANKSHDG